jgi:hypothetical protein
LRKDISKAETPDGLVAELRAALTVCRKVHNDKTVLKDRWVRMDLLPKMLKQSNPKWDVRNYGISKKRGFSRLLALPDIQDYFEMKVVAGIKFLREKHTMKYCFSASVHDAEAPETNF